MKKQIYIASLLITTLVFSCGQNSSEKKLNGKWYGIEDNGLTRMHFYPDSLIITVDPYEKAEWKATKSKIEFDYPIIVWDSSGEPNTTQDKITVRYKLSKGKDTLFGTFVNQSGEFKLNLLRTKNYIEYINKRYGVELPIDNSVELIKTDAIYGLKVFMRYSNNEIIGKTELSENLNHLESDIKKFRDSIKPNTQHQVNTHEILLDHRFHLRVFANKNVPDSSITKYLQATNKVKFSTIAEHIPEAFRDIRRRDTLPIKIYRIYQSEEKYSLGVLKGKEIKTIAKTIYY